MIKPENDRKAEDVTWPTFAFERPWICPFQQNRKIICQYGDVDGRKVYKTGFPGRKIISLCKLVSDLHPISILTGEIAGEVTGVVGASPALWYFRYIASIFSTLHTRLWLGFKMKRKSYKMTLMLRTTHPSIEYLIANAWNGPMPESEHRGLLRFFLISRLL